jgi:hypothetical protein
MDDRREPDVGVSVFLSRATPIVSARRNSEKPVRMGIGRGEGKERKRMCVGVADLMLYPFRVYGRAAFEEEYIRDVGKRGFQPSLEVGRRRNRETVEEYIVTAVYEFSAQLVSERLAVSAAVGEKHLSFRLADRQ